MIDFIAAMLMIFGVLLVIWSCKELWLYYTDWNYMKTVHPDHWTRRCQERWKARYWYRGHTPMPPWLRNKPKPVPHRPGRTAIPPVPLPPSYWQEGS